MKNDAQPLPSAKWSWSAIGLFVLACATAPVVAWWQQASSGDDFMAAGLDGLLAFLGVFVIGLPFAIAAALKERRRRVLCGISSFLYTVPLLALLCCLLVYLANRR
jgi:ABC-type nitrate/sulfonate/bicarbonate transport system permease component